MQTIDVSHIGPCQNMSLSEFADFCCASGYPRCYFGISKTWFKMWCIVQCAKKLGIDFSAISDCMNSTYGNQYEHDMALLTGLLHPPHTYVPWVTLNWVRNAQVMFFVICVKLVVF